MKNHVRNILEKLQLHSRMEAAMYAVRQQHLIDPPHDVTTPWAGAAPRVLDPPSRGA